MEFPELHLGFAQAIGGLGIAGLHFSFEPKLLLRLIPLLRAGVQISKVEMEARGLWPQANRFVEFALGAGNFAQGGVILRHHLVGACGVRKTSFEGIEHLLGKETGSSAVVIEQIGIIWMTRHGFLQQDHRF